MSIYNEVAEFLGKVDDLKGLAGAIEDFGEAYKNASWLDAGAAAGQIAAEVAVGLLVTARVRVAFSSLRLGLAITGNIDQWEALSKLLGINGGIYVGKLIDEVNSWDMGIAIYDLIHPEIDSDVNSEFNAALNFIQRRDPLTLDLDGDGIETVSANTGITFDFDGDGLKTGTGWVKGDDGFLVLDRNGNGTIDNGGELFGVDTVKRNGQKATDGFDALRDLDSNADGVFDAQDAQFANVRVWQDTNQDGIAQAGELTSLAEQHITAINLDSTQANQNSNGNVISGLGTFVRDTGVVGTITGNRAVRAKPCALKRRSKPYSLPIRTRQSARVEIKKNGQLG